MKVVLLKKQTEIPTTNSYLVFNDKIRHDNTTTLVDIGYDPSIIYEIKKTLKSTGREKVNRVILTHQNSNHKGIIRTIKETYNPRIYSVTKDDSADEFLQDGQIIRICGYAFEIIHVSVNSHSCICLYSKEAKILFSGNMPLEIISIGGSYQKQFVETLEKLRNLDIKTIFSGYEMPFRKNIKRILDNTLKNVKTSGLFL